jgi:hypothetical protein
MTSLSRRELLKGALAAVVFTSIPAARVANASPLWAEAIDLVPGPRAGEVAAELDNLNFPWRLMSRAGGIRIDWTDGSGSFWNSVQRTIYLSEQRVDWSYTVGHELGHAVDTLLLSPNDRAVITEFLHSGCEHGWLNHNVVRRERMGERFATLCSDIFGGRYVHDAIFEHYGPNEAAQRAYGARPDRVLDFIATVILSREVYTMSQQFTDVPEHHPHRQNIEDVARAGIAQGYNDGTFRPEAPVTRGQMATFIARALDVVDTTQGWRGR